MLAGPAPGLCTQTVVYQTAGGTPGAPPTEGRNSSLPGNPANDGAAVAMVRTVTTAMVRIRRKLACGMEISFAARRPPMQALRGL